jgi:hypothetical protein
MRAALVGRRGRRLTCAPAPAGLVPLAGVLLRTERSCVVSAMCDERSLSVQVSEPRSREPDDT